MSYLGCHLQRIVHSISSGGENEAIFLQKWIWPYHSPLSVTILYYLSVSSSGILSCDAVNQGLQNWFRGCCLQENGFHEEITQLHWGYPNSILDDIEMTIFFWMVVWNVWYIFCVSMRQFLLFTWWVFKNIWLREYSK